MQWLGDRCQNIKLSLHGLNSDELQEEGAKHLSRCKNLIEFSVQEITTAAVQQVASCCTQLQKFWVLNPVTDIDLKCILQPTFDILPYFFLTRNISVRVAITSEN